ncbi:glycosyltransferase involved in cell wall biosynthesis [Arthrobacter psychrochitiniphilus]|nr:glycosyltransferase involved in cell wall biosynthesis [Arthrobacter psychrochitiniphilus]
MKLAIIAESFLPEMNGVTHSLLKILQHLDARGDEVLVIAPSAAGKEPRVVEGARVRRLPAIALARYPNIRIAAGGVLRVKTLLTEFQPDVVHLASPSC